MQLAYISHVACRYSEDNRECSAIERLCNNHGWSFKVKDENFLVEDNQWARLYEVIFTKKEDQEFLERKVASYR